MTPLRYHLATLFLAIALTNTCYAEKKSAIILEANPDDGPVKKIVIQLLTPLEEHGFSSGGSPSDVTVGLECVAADDHGFLYTSEGELFIDNMYAGKFDSTDTLQFGYNRLWANGAPCILSQVSKRQAKIIYNEKPPGGVQADGSSQIAEIPYRIFLKPVSDGGGGSNGNGKLIIRDGMHILRIEGGVLYVNGISFGGVNRGEEIRVIDGRISVNGGARFPQPDRMQKESETGGTGQPTAPLETKSEGKDKPQPEPKPATR